LSFAQRTTACGDVTDSEVGKEIVLNGWVNRVRDHGGFIFLDVRDRDGIVQVVADGSASMPAHEAASGLRSESCVSVSGLVRLRPEGTENEKLKSGKVEILAKNIELLNPSKPLPFPVAEDANVDEMLRLKYRYLDLRRPAMYEKLRVRHEVIRLMRQYMYRHGFLEIETPIITRATPEGARDYLVPYRLTPGLFYALPQAPQQFKQLLMVSGIERYFQMAKCFRDEAQRADRQPEFTQLDLEMSFVTQDDILNLVENLFIEVCAEVTEKVLPFKPFVRLTYDEAMERYGSDKPDLRYGLELKDCANVFASTQFSVFQSVLGSGGQIKAIVYPGGTSLSRKEIDDLTLLAKEFGAKGLAYLLVNSDGIKSPIAKFMSKKELDGVIALTEAKPGDLIAFVADKKEVVAKVLDRLRREIAERLHLASDNELAFCWITDFPVFEWDEDANDWTYAHNPFSMPHEEHVDLLETDPAICRAYCYDMVCNGQEAASGSIRIHKPAIQRRVLKMIGKSDDEIQAQFGHMLEAFEYGAPPHGGIAPGIDRFIARLFDTDNIREVIAFPKAGNGYDPLMDAPSTVDLKQLRDLHLEVKYPPKKEEK
jgi:aspartyl-tRNA synthetase